MPEELTEQARDTLWRRLLDRSDIPGASSFLGWELIDLDVKIGWCEAHFTGTGVMANPGGNMQGGFISAMLDDVMSIAACIVQPTYGMAPTLQMTTNFLRPVPLAKVRVRGEVVRAGKSAVHTQGFLYDYDGKLLATAVAACMPRAMPLPDFD